MKSGDFTHGVNLDDSGFGETSQVKTSLNGRMHNIDQYSFVEEMGLIEKDI